MKVILVNFKVLEVKTGNTTPSQSEGATYLLKLWFQEKFHSRFSVFGIITFYFMTNVIISFNNSQFQEFLVFWFLSFVFLTNWMSRFQESNSLIRNSQFLNFSYLGILEFAMNVGFSQNGFSANKIPSFQIPSFVIPTKTFLVLSFPVSCVNRYHVVQLPVQKYDKVLLVENDTKKAQIRDRNADTSF